MLRTALRPQWLAVLVLVLLVASGMTMLGRWQLDRARVHGAQESGSGVAQQPRPIEQVIQPRATFPKTAAGARVVATGEWDGARRLLISGRKQAGPAGSGPDSRGPDSRGYWLLVPLRMSDGSAVGVVRGWVAGPGDPAAQPDASPAGVKVQVTGVLQPSEPPIDRAPGEGSGLPAGQLSRVAITDLITAWPYPLITGFVLAQQEQVVDGAGQAAGAALAGPALGRVEPQAAPTGLDWRNLAYAVQWWLFAGFGLFMWWRLVRDDYLSRAAPPEIAADSPAEVPEPRLSGAQRPG